MSRCYRDIIIHVLSAGQISKNCWMKIENNANESPQSQRVSSQKKKGYPCEKSVN